MKILLNDDEIKDLYLSSIADLNKACDEGEQRDIGHEGALIWVLEKLFSEEELNR